MPMGTSGGRSRGNRLAQGAQQRRTLAERSYEVPPRPAPGEPTHVMFDEEPRWVLTPRGEKAMGAAAAVTYVALIAFAIFLLGAWFGAWAF